MKIFIELEVDGTTLSSDGPDKNQAVNDAIGAIAEECRRLLLYGGKINHGYTKGHKWNFSAKLRKSLPRIDEMWVNQPSTLQPDHELHGKNVLTLDLEDGDDHVDILVLSGSVSSQRIARSSLSKGCQRADTE